MGGKELRPPNFSLEKHFEDRLEWMRKNLKSPNFSPEWRERNWRVLNVSSTSRSADISLGSTKEPPQSEVGGSCETSGAGPLQIGCDAQVACPCRLVESRWRRHCCFDSRSTMEEPISLANHDNEDSQRNG